MRTLLAVVALAFAPVCAGAQPPDEGNVAGRFVRDVASDYKNFLSLDSATWLGVGGAAALATHAADESIATWVQDTDRASLPGGSQYGSQYLHIPVAIAWWALGAAAGSDRHAAAGRDLLRAQLSVVSWTYVIKYASGRTRPNGDPRSFPSGHASTSFATAMVLQQHYGWKVGLPAFAAAGYSGVSRVLDNQHWASDVVFGAFVGLASARTVSLRLRDNRVSIAPLAVHGGGGVIVSTVRSSS